MKYCVAANMAGSPDDPRAAERRLLRADAQSA